MRVCVPSNGRGPQRYEPSFSNVWGMSWARGHVLNGHVARSIVESGDRMSWQVEFRRVQSGPEGALQLGYWVLGIGDESVELEAPWGAVGGDPYPDLIRAIREICERADRSALSWVLEPGEYRWEFAREGDNVTVKIVDSGGSFDHVLFDNSCRLRELVRAVSSALTSVDGSEDLTSWLAGDTSETDI